MGAGILSAGTWAQRTAIGWLAWDLTRSVPAAGLFILVELFAALWVAPLAGVVTDRSRPQILLTITTAGSCILALSLGGLAQSAQLTLPLLWIIALLDASLRGFAQPSQMLAPGLLCKQGQLPRAVATSAVTIALSISLGPAIAGAIMHLLGSVSLVFLLNAFTQVSFLAVVRTLKRRLDRRPHLAGNGIWQEMREGFGYALKTTSIRQVLGLALLFSFLGRPFIELLPTLVGNVFQGNAGLLASLMSAQGFGALIGSVFMLCYRQDTSQLFKTLCFAGIGIACAVLGMVATEQRELMLIAICLAGLFHVICNICMQSLCQLRSETRIKGRVIALYSLIFRVVPSTSAFLVSQAAPLIPISLLLSILAVIQLILFAKALIFEAG
ncbi:MFS transporter [Pseudomonas sp. LRF_L74]|uniref:MFS transporter n=1 Tax=Pseudomonas sp. LRF_L74 TaxID=3369422 RepID=UPI003F63523C